MREAFIEKNLRRNSLIRIHQANEIIEEYARDGYTLTLRQLYYQFVARDLLENTQQNYKRLGNIISNGRLAGYIDWDAIEDRTRNLQKQWHFDSPKDAIEQMRRQYVIDMWENQSTRCEVWIEKEALVGVISRICQELDVPYFACRGFVSQSEMYSAGKRADNFYHEHGQDTVIIHLGDHDPSGMDMTRDNGDRMYMFGGLSDPRIIRIALNMNQIEAYDPPPNFAKLTDSRSKNYIRKYGDKSWELDALDPKVITKLIKKTVDEFRDIDLWNEKQEQLDGETDRLDEIIEELE